MDQSFNISNRMLPDLPDMEEFDFVGFVTSNQEMGSFMMQEKVPTNVEMERSIFDDISVVENLSYNADNLD